MNKKIISLLLAGMFLLTGLTALSAVGVSTQMVNNSVNSNSEDYDDLTDCYINVEGMDGWQIYKDTIRAGRPVVTGNGFSDDPYVIEGWKLKGVTLKNCYNFIIKKCWMINPANGINLINIKQGSKRISDCVLDGCSNGIQIDRVNDIVIEGCKFYDCDFAFKSFEYTMEYSNNVIISDCEIHNAELYGIRLYRVKDSEVNDCSIINSGDSIYFSYVKSSKINNCKILNCEYGIKFEKVENSEINDCRIFNCKQFHTVGTPGVHLMSSSSNVIQGCDITECDIGIRLQPESFTNRISSNNLYYNGQNYMISCPSTMINTWTGNYWQEELNPPKGGLCRNSRPCYLANSDGSYSADIVDGRNLQPEKPTLLSRELVYDYDDVKLLKFEFSSNDFNNFGPGNGFDIKVDWGDGTKVETEEPNEMGKAIFQHVFLKENEYTITVTAVDRNDDPDALHESAPLVFSNTKGTIKPMPVNAFSSLINVFLTRFPLLSRLMNFLN